MNRAPRTQPRRDRLLGVATLAALALLLAGSHLIVDNGGGAAPTPSYAALRPLLQAGAGKGLDDGVIELFQTQSPNPAAWIWTVDDTRDGSGREIWVFHSGFVHPGPDDASVTMRYDFVDDYTPASLEAFLAWIVARSPHVLEASELVVHEYVVSSIQ